MHGTIVDSGVPDQYGIERLLQQFLGDSDLSPWRHSIQLLYVRVQSAYPLPPTQQPYLTLVHRLVIGLFGLVGMFGVALGPLVGRVIDSLVPWYASLISLVFLVCFQSIQVAAGGINIAAVILATLGLDIFRQMLQVSLSTSVFR